MAFIELSKTHFFHNLSLISKRVRSIENIAIVLKDNAYGHGLLEMAQMAQEFGVNHAIVKNLKEAKPLVELFQTVLVLADLPVEKVADNIHITINDLSIISKLSPKTKVEIKVDSGMHRNGINPDDLDKAISAIIEHDLDLVGIFTHHRSADSLSSEFFWQKKNFELIKAYALELCEENKLPTPRFHSLNSAGCFRDEKISEDIVRVGIAAYGLLQMQTPLLQPELKPVLSLWAEKIHTFTADSQMHMGYNGKGKVSSEQNISTYDIGYGDGLLRLNDEESFVTHEGVELIGRVSMDNIIASSEAQHIELIRDANDYAQAAHTIAYEVTTRLNPDLKRKITTN